MEQPSPARVSDSVALSLCSLLLTVPRFPRYEDSAGHYRPRLPQVPNSLESPFLVNAYLSYCLQYLILLPLF
jgi:hypothetical protein